MRPRPRPRPAVRTREPSFLRSQYAPFYPQPMSGARLLRALMRLDAGAHQKAPRGALNSAHIFAVRLEAVEYTLVVLREWKTMGAKRYINGGGART